MKASEREAIQQGNVQALARKEIAQFGEVSTVQQLGSFASGKTEANAKSFARTETPFQLRRYLPELLENTGPAVGGMNI